MNSWCDNTSKKITQFNDARICTDHLAHNTFQPSVDINNSRTHALCSLVPDHDVNTSKVTDIHVGLPADSVNVVGNKCFVWPACNTDECDSEGGVVSVPLDITKVNACDPFITRDLSRSAKVGNGNSHTFIPDNVNIDVGIHKSINLTCALNLNIRAKSGNFSFVHWNVNGLFPKLSDVDFTSFITLFDFICLVETFMVDFTQFDLFPNYKVFCKAAINFPGRGRASGGVLVLIRNELLPFFCSIECKHANTLLFTVAGKLLGVDKDTLCICAYVPPDGSPFYTHFDVENGISLLEECVTECLLDLNDVYIMLIGDFNARTAGSSQNIFHDCTNDLFSNLHMSHALSNERHSQDSSMNSYGKLLMNFCTSFDLAILNGLCTGDNLGRYTYIAQNGSSVIDYFILSKELLFLLWDICKLNIIDRIESDHLPLSFSICPTNNFSEPDTKECTFIDKFVWNADAIGIFNEKLLSYEVQRKFKIAMDTINTDLDNALLLFNECLKDVAECMKKRVCVNKQQKRDWYDNECRMFRKNVKHKLSVYKKSLNIRDRDIFCIARREYKSLLKRKKKEFNDLVMSNLLSSVNNQQDFWKNVRGISIKNPCLRNTISTENWFLYFKELLDKPLFDEQDTTNDIDDDYDTDDDVMNDVLNSAITKEEIVRAVRKLKCNKSAGPDSLIAELFKYSGTMIIDFLHVFFNALFEKGIFPKNWTHSIVIPLYKKGNINDPNNYRGISLCDISSKLYSRIINDRLQTWVNMNDIIGECQAGFKKGYSSVDNMFTLLACIQRQFSLKRKLYVAFIDFEKAFDSINRNLLWPILLSNKVKGKCLKCIKSMYAHLRTRVRAGAELTDFINCTTGVKQGDVLSPLLFSLFINELALEVINNGRHGITFPLDDFILYILLLADDVALLSETVIGLQTQLNNLQIAASRLKLKVNIGKSNIIVFRKGGFLGVRERWTLNGTCMPVVNAYKYLGILFSTRLSFSASCQDLVSKAKCAVIYIMKKLYCLNNNSVNVFLKLFDSCVQPIALYGAEIWALDASAMYCEKVHLFALKKFLGLHIKTPNDLIYGEFNRYPITINASLKCIRYWIKITQMTDSRLPRKAYLMLHNLDEKGKINWVTKIRLFLCQHGFGWAWFSQSVGNSKVFISVLKQRLIDSRWQNWEAHILESEKFTGFRTLYGISHNRKLYLDMNIDRNIKRAVCKFRFGFSNLILHKYRYSPNSTVNVLCPLCKNAKDDEIHFVLCCSFLDKLRQEFIQDKYWKKPNAFRLMMLLNSTNELTVKMLSVYIYKALKVREIYLS